MTTNELSRIESTLPALKADDEATKIVESVASYWPDDGSPPALRRELIASERKLLSERIRALNAALRGICLSMTDRERAAKAIALMFTGFPSLRNADAAGMVAAYLSFFDDLPLFAILRACEAVTRGDLGDSSEFPPTAPSMFKCAEEALAPLVAEKSRLERLISAKQTAEQLSERQRERVAAKFEKLSADLQKPMREERERRALRSAELLTEVNDRTREREYADAKLEPVQHISLALKSLLQAQKQTEDN